MEGDARLKHSLDALQACLNETSQNGQGSDRCMVRREDLRCVLEHVSAVELRMADLERRFSELKDYALHWPKCGINFGLLCDCGLSERLEQEQS